MNIKIKLNIFEDGEFWVIEIPESIEVFDDVNEVINFLRGINEEINDIANKLIKFKGLEVEANA
ncbi:MAG: hypothetical protein DRJ21_00255 [Candidatus Methanomethylicota archaeon]|uniref:Uncharacterized protein n=1 Tax=Thermoproteota archaeon TaxID=2056631 RepID=A0A497EXJ6_9CREN|nr:MAG: hypothetical protein DRJ21_00255 [Candidatus Verstraetearchaeota archaeon]